LFKDSNNNIRYLGASYAKSESSGTWKEFLQHIRACGGVLPGFVISDRDKGIISAVAETFPELQHLHCRRHLMENYKRKFRSKDLVSAAWNLFTATSTDAIDACRQAFSVIKQGDQALIYLEQSGLQHFCDAFVNVKHYGITTTNNCESANNQLVSARTQTVLSMLSEIEYASLKQCSDSFKNLISFKSPFTNYANEIVKGNEGKNFAIQVRELTDESFLVTELEDCLLVSKLEAGYQCTCSAPNIGIPCRHIRAVINFTGQGVAAFVDKVWLRDTYATAYDKLHQATPVLLKDFSESALQLPVRAKQRGRPRDRRVESQHTNGPNDAPRRIRRCTKCKAEGHNARTCEA
jgi:hypothetical protein